MGRTNNQKLRTHNVIRSISFFFGGFIELSRPSFLAKQASILLRPTLDFSVCNHLPFVPRPFHGIFLVKYGFSRQNFVLSLHVAVDFANSKLRRGLLHHSITFDVSQPLYNASSSFDYGQQSVFVLAHDLSPTAEKVLARPRNTLTIKLIFCRFHRDMETFIHLLKGSLGSGILAMPLAFMNAGLIFGLVATAIIGFVCTYCVHILVRLTTATRYNRIKLYLQVHNFKLSYNCYPWPH